jgi:uncharacterized protein with HEPN domain
VELQTLAESTLWLSDEFKMRHPNIPYQNISGFRNVIVHDYLGIEPVRVWEIVEVDLRSFRKSLIEAMKDLRG